ncbi:MAG: hypothetical protein ACLT3Y_00920 [Ruminococcus callidus]
MDYQNFGMGTTCVAALQPEYVAVQCGRQPGYFWGRWKQVTRITRRAYALERGEIQREMETHPQRHMLMKAVGVERTVCPDFFRIDRKKTAVPCCSARRTFRFLLGCRDRKF